MLMETVDVIFRGIERMSSAEQMPKGGFFRGVLAGTAFSGIIVIALSTAFAPPPTVYLAPDVPDIATADIAPPSEPAPATPVIDAPAPTPAPVVPADSPVAVSDTGSKPATPATQTSPVAPQTAVVETAAQSPDTVEDKPASPESIDISTYGVPSSVESPPQVESSGTVAVVDPSTQTAALAASVPVANSGFSTSGNTDIGTTSGDSTAGLATSAGAPNLPTISAPALSGTTAPAGNAPQTPASVAKPSGGFTMTGQSIIPSQPVDSTDVVVPTEPQGAFVDFAREFAAPANADLVSVILLVNSVEDAANVAKMSAPVTIAVRPDTPDAAKIVASYRATGGEVLMFLPANGKSGLLSEADVAARAKSIAANLATLPGVIGIVDGPDGKLPANSKLLAAVLSLLKTQGYGIVTTNGLGLNRAQIMAQQESVPVASISEQIDLQPGKIPVIRQMDKAVLQVAASGNAVVFGTASSDVLSALRFWFGSTKAQTVTMAPASAIMRRP